MWLLEVDDSDDVKQRDLVKVEEKVVEVEKEEVEEQPLPLLHLRPPARDRGNQAMAFEIPCLWQHRKVNIMLKGNMSFISLHRDIII